MIMESTEVFRGSIIHSTGLSNLEVLEDATIIVTHGHISSIYKSSDSVPPNAIPTGTKVQNLPAGDFLIPGFVDTHNHAPQWPMRGRGQGLHILDWLDQVTFPVEARFADASYAARIYEDTVGDFLRHGITTASYYSSRHAEATKILADTCHRKGQRAFIGKCNMDRNAPDYLVDTDAESSLRETRECIHHIRSLKSEASTTPLVHPVVTPRFAISCTPNLLRGLGNLLEEDPSLAMQTHFNEAQQEIDFTTSLFPDFGGSEAALYAHFNLLTPRSILAHCTLMSESETASIAHHGCGVAHCPIANMTVGGGFMVAPIRAFLARGIKVGLGTDSGGGWASQMLAVIRQTLIASNAQEVRSGGRDKALALEEAFYLATVGGARVMCLEEEIGNFEVGKAFDAIWVRTTSGLGSAMTPVEEGDGVRGMWEKFLLTGDDRNMRHVYVNGRRVAGCAEE
ncbi:hypothetical protein DE146DRAFT_722946 [Phaeosphaeria sp. MPI-PUGE-AT-0046c]|nr:hypothetical protein DE146DRAFT_722946 [Phaeosphaeria sp. MPI-PUGE-AT-0046c]